MWQVVAPTEEAAGVEVVTEEVLAEQRAIIEKQVDETNPLSQQPTSDTYVRLISLLASAPVVSDSRSDIYAPCSTVLADGRAA